MFKFFGVSKEEEFEDILDDDEQISDSSLSDDEI